MKKPEYDISLAAQAIRALELEAHTQEECEHLVWSPTKFWLNQLANEKPKTIVCFHGDVARLSLPTSNVFAVAAENRVVYLGTAVSQAIAKEKLQIRKKLAKATHQKLLHEDPMIITKSSMERSLPVPGAFNTASLRRALPQHLATIAPRLSEVPISWMKNKQRDQLTVKIMVLAGEHANVATLEERIQILRGDL